ncbi:MAG: DUF2075 domain-containing protein, partial [Acidimicrobiia bacterium]|nr:DUF2075 domain-containing protein [Acidimicrobiia bacterium]
MERDVPVNQAVIEFEQGRVDAVHLAAEEELRGIDKQLACLLSVNKSEQKALVDLLLAKKKELESSDPALCFARFDLDSHEMFYIGRRLVEVAGDEPVTVVNWRAELAQRFYQATAENPMGLRLRRRFDLDGDQRTILQVGDDRLGHDAPEDDPGAPTFADLLLSDLATERSGYLADIVATIQADQDRVIRLPHDRPVVIQGGPGTGKTVVGLHRLSFLLYSQANQLRAQDVLVVGPNPMFLDYARRVLPSLGDGDVRL